MNKAFYDAGNVIDELMDAAVKVFGRHVLLQFEDFNTNDAFPLLQRQRDRYLTFNDDIQGTAAVTVAGLLGALKLQHSKATELLPLLADNAFLMHGAGAANLGTANLLVSAGVPKEHIYLTNSRGLVWQPRDNSKGGSARNAEQRAFAVRGEPPWPHSKLNDIIAHVEPSFLIGATGKMPGCFDKDVIDAMLKAQVRADEHPHPDSLSFSSANYSLLKQPYGTRVGMIAHNDVPAAWPLRRSTRRASDQRFSRFRTRRRRRRRAQRTSTSGPRGRPSLAAAVSLRRW